MYHTECKCVIKFLGVKASDKKQSSSSTIVPTKKKEFSHPINPNHRTVSHFSVMSAGGQKGTWSIEKNKKSATVAKDRLAGKIFSMYNNTDFLYELLIFDSWSFAIYICTFS